MLAPHQLTPEMHHTFSQFFTNWVISSLDGEIIKVCCYYRGLQSVYIYQDGILIDTIFCDGFKTKLEALSKFVRDRQAMLGQQHANA